MDKKETLRLKISGMEALMSRLREFGATDSEPDGNWQFSLVQAAARGKVSIPSSAREWELFQSVSGSEKAAQKLSAKAKAICSWIVKNNMNGELNGFLKDLCWRISWPF